MATAIAVLGVVANNRRYRSCFILWILSNAATAFIHLHQHIYSLAARDVIFLLLAIEGLYLWRKDKWPSK